MRKVFGILVAAALMAPVGVLTAATPAGAVGGTACKALTGTATFKPPLPKVGSTTKVKPTVGITGAKLTGCVGGGVTKGTVNASLKFGIAGNCESLIKGTSHNVKGPLTIIWSATKKSTVTASLTRVAGKPPTVQKVAGPVTAGLFKGSKMSATTQYTLPSGACGTTALSKVTFKLLAGTKMVIK